MTTNPGGCKAPVSPPHKPAASNAIFSADAFDPACAMCTCDREASAVIAKNPS